MFTRAVDPVIPQIAAEFAIDLNTAALLSTAYTLPYALVQPVLGTVADFFGKTRLMNLAVLIVSIAALICALAPSFPVLVATRIGAGLIAGGVFPVAMALIGDLAPVHQRQVAIGRLLAIGLTGNLIGASIAGVIGDVLGWRGVFAVLGGFSLIVAVAAFFLLRRVAIAKPPVPFNLATAIAGFRGIFADPRAKVCFGAVFLEAIFIHGLFPYVAILLLAAGEARASIAGLVIAAFGLGGVVYSVGISVIIARVAERRLMIAGGGLAAAGLVLAAFHLPWYAQVGSFAVLGFGFHLLPAASRSTSPNSRRRARRGGLAAFVLLLSQAGGGAVVYRFGFAHAGPGPSLFAGAVVVVLIGLVCSQLLRHRSSH
ncbi:MAG: transporter, family, inner rane transport protein [Alphaproteobacteria bacterium]|nr:transporter, family, inner rane transport protein [Alphaproteobacteria bacterium]